MCRNKMKKCIKRIVGRDASNLPIPIKQYECRTFSGDKPKLRTARKPEKVAVKRQPCALTDDLFLNFCFSITHAGSNVYYTFTLFKQKENEIGNI